MIRTVLIAPLLFALGACDGAYTGPIGSEPVETYAFGAATAVPSAAGSFAGVAATDTSVVQDSAGNGYAFAYSIVNAADYNAGTGQANLAIAGVLPDTNLGTAPSTGSAVMTGTYQIVRVTGASAARDPGTWTVERPTGTLTADINFATGALSGISDDGALTLTASTDAGFASGFQGDAAYDGTAGTFEGVIGPDHAVASMTGQDDTSFFAGGFAIER